MGKHLDAVKKLTRDPGAHYVAALCDTLEGRLDVCCPPPDINPKPEALRAAPKADESADKPEKITSRKK